MSGTKMTIVTWGSLHAQLALPRCIANQLPNQWVLARSMAPPTAHFADTGHTGHCSCRKMKTCRRERSACSAFHQHTGLHPHAHPRHLVLHTWRPRCHLATTPKLSKTATPRYSKSIQHPLTPKVSQIYHGAPGARETRAWMAKPRSWEASRFAPHRMPRMPNMCDMS